MIVPYRVNLATSDRNVRRFHWTLYASYINSENRRNGGQPGETSRTMLTKNRALGHWPGGSQRGPSDTALRRRGDRSCT